MADIGNLSAKVGASSAGLPGDLAKAATTFGAGASALEKAAHDKGKSIGDKLGAGITSGFAKLKTLGNEGFTNPLKSANDVLLGGITDFVGKIPAIGGILAAPLAAVSFGIGTAIGIYEANADRIEHLGKGAAKAGLQVEDFQLLSRLVGSVDGAASSWAKFNQKLADASMAGEGVRTVFDKFGLDGKALATEFESDFSGALGKVFDKARTLPMSLQTRFARDLFGKQGLEMMPTILMGSDKVNAEKDRMARMGLGVDGGLVANVRQAKSAKKEIDALWEGFGNQITMAVAPALAIISERIGKLPGGFAGLASTIVDKVGTAAEFVASIIDGWTNGDMMDRMAPYWEEFKAKGGEVIDWVVEKFSSGIKSAFGVPEVQAFFNGITDFRSGDEKNVQATRDFENKAQADRFQALANKGNLLQDPEYLALAKFHKDMALDPNHNDEDHRARMKARFQREWREGNAGGNDGGGGNWNATWDKDDQKSNMEGMFDQLREDYKGDAAGFAEATDFFGLDDYFGKAKLKVMAFKADVIEKMSGKGPEIWKDSLAPFREKINKINDDAGGPAKEFDDAMKNLQTTLDAVAKADPFKNAVAGAKDMLGVFDGGLLDGVGKIADGLGEIDKGAAELQAFKTFDKLKSQFGDTGKLAGAMEQGGAQAYSAIANFENQKPEDVQQEMKRLLEAAERQRQEQIEIGKNVLAAMKAGKPKVVGIP